MTQGGTLLRGGERPTYLSQLTYQRGYAVRKFQAANSGANHAVATAFALLLFGVSLGGGHISVSAAESIIAAGETLPIVVSSEDFDEAEDPSVDPADSGGGFWIPGPERFHGWALRDLLDYLQRMTGAHFPLTRREKGAQRDIFAGTFADFADFNPTGPEAQKAFASTDPEAFVVEVQGDNLFILGRSKAGMIAGIYTLLDRLGCKWLAPGEVWENVPQLRGLTLGDKLNAASRGPSYQARFFYCSFGPNSDVSQRRLRATQYALWCLRNRMGGSAYTANHHNDPAMVPPELFQQRPELFALAQGKRNAYGLSRANPDTLTLALESAVKYLKANEGKGSYYRSFSVETNDGSPACEESLKKIGNHTATDLNYWFANEMAAGIEKAGLKDKWVGMCSYSDHAGIPSFNLHPRVAVVVTTGLDFSSGGLTVEQRLDGLRDRGCKRLGLYDYLNLITWSLDKPGCSPAADALLVAANLKRWHNHGATTYLAETSDSWISGGAGHYLAARLLWDVTADSQDELNAYYRAAFGPAAAEIRALNEDWAALPLKVKMPPGALPGLPKISRERCARWHEWISRAESQVKDKPALLARIKALKRYYLYLNLTREFELDLVDPRLPSKQERYIRLLRYVGSNRGEGSFHALGLFVTLLSAAPQHGLDSTKWPQEFAGIATNITDEKAWQTFPSITDAEIDAMFSAAALPTDGSLAAGTFDPRLAVVSTAGSPPAELKFPKLHGPPGVARQYVLRVTAPTPKLTFEIVTGSPHGAGMPQRTVLLTDERGNELKRLEFSTDRPASFDVTDLQPGVYLATFPEFGAEQITVRGGNTLGAVRTAGDGWGFNPMRRSDHKESDELKAYFVIPPGRESLSVRLSEGVVAVGLEGDRLLAAEIRGTEGAPPHKIMLEPSDTPKVAYVKMVRATPSTMGLVIEGVTHYSSEPAHVLYERLD